jgi:radical SAM protein with 4Fe4S-binding SPASM domain
MFSNCHIKYFRKNKNVSGKHAASIPAHILNDFNKTRPKNAARNLCNAPFRNMYFDPDGNVYVCCYNQKHPFGKYPDNTISEIWNSANAKTLRSCIKNNDLSFGCGECRTALEANQFLSAHIPFYDNYFDVSDGPTMLELQISNNCNLECTMCSEDLSSSIYAKRGNHNTSKSPYDKEYIHQISVFLPKLKYVLFTGGEPFIIPVYFELWEKLIEVNPACNLMIQTNGTILNEKIKSLLEKGNFHIGISLDSLNETTYQGIRINASLKETLKNIQYFSEYCHRNKRFIGISFCPMRQNWKEIPDMINFCNSNDLEIYFNTVWYPGKNALWLLETEKLEEIINTLRPLHFERKTPVQKKNADAYTNLLRTLQRWHDAARKYDKYKPNPSDPGELRKIENEILERISQLFTLNAQNSSEEINNNSLITSLKKTLDAIPDNDIKLKSLQVISQFNDNKILSNIFRENEEGLALLIKNIYRLPEIK